MEKTDHKIPIREMNISNLYKQLKIEIYRCIKEGFNDGENSCSLNGENIRQPICRNYFPDRKFITLHNVKIYSGRII